MENELLIGLSYYFKQLPEAPLPPTQRWVFTLAGPDRFEEGRERFLWLKLSRFEAVVVCENTAKGARNTDFSQSGFEKLVHRASTEIFCPETMVRVVQRFLSPYDKYAMTTPPKLRLIRGGIYGQDSQAN